MDSGTQDENPFLSGTEISPQTDVPLSFTESSYVPAVVEGNLDSRDEENAADQRVLLHDSGDGTSKPGVFSAERYQVYFNVDTKDVLRRIYDSMFIPGDGMGFLEKTTHQPDFYGPFWICTTLIFVTAAGGSAVEALNNKDEAWYYDVGEVTFSAFLFYGYATIVPIVLYFAAALVAKSGGAAVPAMPVWILSVHLHSHLDVVRGEQRGVPLADSAVWMSGIVRVPGA
eukprot:CAMPEP_0114235980 /NCGR_PEP_ID=MMETSP0058-20121206/6558_1 /TAXON_ID=36894 /ORGANISM="Pyramimonas parkeae, CCMP726" /LENGTH=227 /DNA_ID=CAMNT_0001347815 /DNA_START=106 /DNA_END=788 /DNA_ORIENTATION=-